MVKIPKGWCIYDTRLGYYQEGMFQEWGGLL